MWDEKIFKNCVARISVFCSVNNVDMGYFVMTNKVDPTQDELRVYDQLIQGGRGTDGDCFRACMATVLQIEPKELPNPHDSDWFLKWDDWLHNRGLGLTTNSGYYGVNGLWIASVKSQNYPDTTHAVVMNDEVVFHDPSPGKKYKSVEFDDILVSYHIELTNVAKLFSHHSEQVEREARISELRWVQRVKLYGMEPLSYLKQKVKVRLANLQQSNKE